MTQGHIFDAFCLDAPSEPLSHPSEAPISRRQGLLHGTTHPASTPQNRHRRLIGHVVLLGSYLACLGMPFSSARGPTIPSLGCLILTWTRYSESGQPRPRTEQRVNVRNRRPTCETAGSHAGRVGTQVAVAHGQSMTDHGAPTHRPAMQYSQELGKHDQLKS